MTIEEQLAAAVAQVETFKAEALVATNAISEATAKATDAEAKITLLNAETARLAVEVKTALDAKIAAEKIATELAAKEQDLDVRANQMAASIVAQTGTQAPVKVTATKPVGESVKRADFEAMSFTDRSAFLTRGGKIEA